MTEFGFKILGKDGKIIEDISFENFDAVADYMLDAADKWYSGLQDPSDTMLIERKEDGQVVFEDRSSFEASVEDGLLHNNGPETESSDEGDTGEGQED
jgi:hypothetical protein